MSMNTDNSHSCITISHGLNKLVTNVNNSEQETSEVQFEEYALKLNASDFACRSKAKAKPKRREPAGSSTRTKSIGKEFGLMLNEENIQSPIMKYQRNWFVFFVMESYLEKTMGRLNSGESKTIFRNISCIVIIGLTTSGRKAWQEEEETRKRYQYCTDSSFDLVPPSSSRSFRTQPHWSYFAGHCGYSDRFLRVHLSCRMCVQFTFTHQLGINTWRTKFEQQTDSILSACGSHWQKP